MANEHQATAQAEIDRIDGEIDSWREQLVVKRRELDAAQAGAGQRVLAGTTTTAKVAQQAAVLREELVTIESVLEALDAQRTAALRARLEAKLLDAREQQQQLREQLAVHEVETARLMALIRAHEGPNARLCGDTQSLYLLERINNYDHSISSFEYQLRQYDAQHPEAVPAPVAA